MQEQQVSYEVAVSKAGLPLRAGESLQQYTQALRDAGTEFIKQKLNVPTAVDNKSGSSVYMMEVFASTAVFELYRWGDTVKAGEAMKFFACKYSREDSGKFSFSDSIEVERVTRFEPKKTLAITKAKGGAELLEKKEAELAPDVDGWQVSTKALWGSLL